MMGIEHSVWVQALCSNNIHRAYVGLQCTLMLAGMTDPQVDGWILVPGWCLGFSPFRERVLTLSVSFKGLRESKFSCSYSEVMHQRE